MGWDADRQAAAPPADRDGSGPQVAGEAPGEGAGRTGHGARRAATVERVRRLARAVLDSDEATVEQAVLRLSRSRRLFAPLALAVGAVIILFDGVKLLFSPVPRPVHRGPHPLGAVVVRTRAEHRHRRHDG